MQRPDIKVVRAYQRDFDNVKKEVSKAVVGQEDVINAILRGLISNGHILVEGIPGIAKTLTIRTIAVVTGCMFSRIQFTVDLLPSDIVGITAYDEKKGFYTVKGPVFANFLLADEINRSPPKCVYKDTPVMLNDGRVMDIENVFKEFNGKKEIIKGNEYVIIPKKNLILPSFNLQSYKIEPRKVKYLYKQKTREPYYKVELTSGREIKTSKVHPFFTIEDGIIKNVSAKNIIPGQCILVPKNVNLDFDNTINYNKDILEEVKKSNLKLKIPIKVDKKLAQLIGFTISEAYHKSNGDFFISMKDKGLVKYVIKLINDVFGYKVSLLRDSRGLWRIAVSCKTFTKLLQAMGYKIDSHSWDKDIPDFIMKADNIILKEFLRAYFEGDGTFSKDCIKATTKSRELANKISYLLLRFGITARIKKEYTKYKGKRLLFYNIRLYGCNAIEFKNKIGFLTKEKNNRISKVGLARLSGRFNDFIPGLHKYLRELRKKTGLTHKEFYKLTNMHSWNLENINNREKHSRFILKQIYNNLKSIYNDEHLRKLIESDFYCDFVKDVNLVIPDEEYWLYDFNVDNNHSFIAGFGGIISHNTQGALLEAMQEKQVTIGKQTFKLPLPFFVMATQNPIEQAGVYPLPEAQIDRFLFKLIMKYPHAHEEEEILKKNITTRSFEEVNLKAVITPKRIAEMQDFVKNIYLGKEIEKYIVAITNATRNPSKYGVNLGKYIEWGGSPRMSIGLYISSKADALIHGENYVTPQNVKNVAYDVMRHRILINYEGQAENIKTDQIIDEILARVPVP